ncbi:MAG: aminotransferase class I/II-fold pyridoxal phosphate-dependent enzyme [Acidobacteriota bacterium]
MNERRRPLDPQSATPPAEFGLLSRLLPQGLDALAQWQARSPVYERDQTLAVSDERARTVLEELTTRLEENYPFFHPDYAGQMLKPPHPIATIAYFLTQQINPNNHALDGGPATAKMEQEVVADLARLFGYEQHLGHLTSSGTIANLEALWVAREIHPEREIAFSSEAHYTHSRMCQVLGARRREIRSDSRGQMDIDDLRSQLKTGTIGTVVVTSGTTALGAVDAIDEVIDLREEFEFRVHVDGAYGGFFKLLSDDESLLGERAARAFRAISRSDSVVVDPHKHGLQPYGCGSVIFRDPAVGKFYQHDSPYTYFTSKDLHLGEISLECSRAGAAAAALWATLRCFPLESEGGLGAILRKTRQAALTWSEMIRECKELQLVVDPSLDIVTFFPVSPDGLVSSISRSSERLFERTMSDEVAPIYLAKLQVKPPLASELPDLKWDAESMVALRSVLMKPEHLAHVPFLHRRVLDALA